MRLQLSLLIMGSDHVGLVGLEPIFEVAGVLINVAHWRELQVALEVIRAEVTRGWGTEARRSS